MDNALAVRVVERRTDLGEDPDRPVPGNRPLPKKLAQGLPLYVLHDQVVKLRGSAEVEDLDDVGMGEEGEDFRLAVKTLSELGVFGELRGEHLERHDPVEVRLPGLVDNAHAPAGDELENFEPLEGGPDFEGQDLVRG